MQYSDRETYVCKIGVSSEVSSHVYMCMRELAWKKNPRNNIQRGHKTRQTTHATRTHATQRQRNCSRVHSSISSRSSLLLGCLSYSSHPIRPLFYVMLYPT